MAPLEQLSGDGMADQAGTARHECSHGGHTVTPLAPDASGPWREPCSIAYAGPMLGSFAARLEGHLYTMGPRLLGRLSPQPAPPSSRLEALACWKRAAKWSFRAC